MTWRFESGFDFQPTNGMHTPSTQTGDVGPRQLYPDTWDKSPYTDGLANPFGTNLNRGQVFNGNAFENLMVAGRALGTAQGAQRANAARIYRAGSSTKQMNYGNGRTLSVQYDNRMRPTQWSIPGVLRLQYVYFWEQTGRVDFVRNLDDETLDRLFPTIMSGV